MFVKSFNTTYTFFQFFNNAQTTYLEEGVVYFSVPFSVFIPKVTINHSKLYRFIASGL